MIHHHSIGDTRITGVIEYSGPTHAPEFLYPAYAVYAAGAESAALKVALEGLREAAGGGVKAAPMGKKPRTRASKN